jgi:hypothetical protein
MITNLRKLVALRGEERRLLLAATALLAVVRLGLWALPLRTVHRLLALSTPMGLRRAAMRPIGWAVGVGSAYVPHATCLTQALVAQALLRRHGLAGELRIGVGRGADGAFAAHAWVESEGEIIVGGPRDYLAHFVPLPAVDRLIS